MRTMLVILALLAAGTAANAGSPSPVSYDYPWCVMGGELGYSGGCSYQTRAQCLASASGRWNLYCDVNRRLLFQRQQAVEQQMCVGGAAGITESACGADKRLCKCQHTGSRREWFADLGTMESCLQLGAHLPICPQRPSAKIVVTVCT
jgi:hypothetical protein